MFYSESTSIWVVYFVSLTHAEFGAGELFLKQPVAHVDGEIYLFTLLDLDLILPLFHELCDELVGDLWGMLSCVYQTELLLLQLFHLNWIKLFIFFKFLPTDFIQALSEEDDKGKNSPIKVILDLL